jgi:TRAP transporter TAXI family solute receptor
MKKRSLNVFWGVMLLTLVGIFLVVQNVHAVTRLSIATAGTAGTWYALGGTIANLISKEIKDTEATAYPSGASIENIRNLRKGQTDMVFLQPDIAYWAYAGTGQFAKEKPFTELRSLMALYPIDEHIVVLEKSPIQTLYDVKGKSVGLGAPGSGIEVMNRLILAEYGITYKDIHPKFLSIAEQVQALKDGNLDICMFGVGSPAPGMMDLQTQRKIRFIEFDQKMMENIHKKYPYYVPREIPSGTYKDQPKPIKVLSWMGIIATSTHLDEKLVYEILNVFWKNKKDIDKIHVQYGAITLKNAVVVPVPLHDAAKKFYKEKGILK